ncbi:hypothetical protein HDU93_008544 [Gonapodya sp. JEL0774]|nr:hypothetical protein HDU93_008544 [Gonapodya sp. JEL0774]
MSKPKDPIPGSFGKVKLGWHKLTSQQVAVKIVDKAYAPAVVREIETWRALRHPNVAQLYEVLTTETKIYMVTEFVPGGEAFDMILRRGRMDDRSPLAKRLFRQVVEAVKYCHDRNLVHRDLKLENVMLTEDMGNVKLIDFGFTREVASLPTQKQLLDTYCGSTAYAAPEMIIGKQYLGPQADIWSLGVILYTLVCGYLPFDDDNENEMKVQKKIKELDYEVPEFISESCRDLITRILKLEPAERIPLSDMLSHPWFVDVPAVVSGGELAGQATTEHQSRTTNESSGSGVQKPIPVELAPIRTFDIARPSHKTSDSSLPLSGKESSEPPITSAVFSPSASPSSSTTSGQPYPILLNASELQIANTLATIGFDVPSILRSVKHNACDQASALWFLLLAKHELPPAVGGAEATMDESATMKGGAWSWARTFLEKQKDGGPASGSVGSLSRPRRKSNELPGVAEVGCLGPVPSTPPVVKTLLPRPEFEKPIPVPADEGDREPITRRGLFDVLRHGSGLARGEGKEVKRKSGAVVIEEGEEEEEEEGRKRTTSVSQQSGEHSDVQGIARSRSTSERSNSSRQSAAVSSRGVYSARTGTSGAARAGRFGVRSGAPVDARSFNTVSEKERSSEGSGWEG